MIVGFLPLRGQHTHVITSALKALSKTRAKPQEMAAASGPAYNDNRTLPPSKKPRV